MEVSVVAFYIKKRRLKHVNDFLYFQLEVDLANREISLSLYIARIRSLQFSMTKKYWNLIHCKQDTTYTVIFCVMEIKGSSGRDLRFKV